MLSLLLLTGQAAAEETWAVVVPEDLAGDEAIKVAVNDLVDAVSARGISMRVVDEGVPPDLPAVIIGGPGRNADARRLNEDTPLPLSGVANPEGYEIITLTGRGPTRIVVAGGDSPLALPYGIYWLWDRLRVQGTMPVVNVKHEPAIEQRYTRIEVREEEDIRRALRHRLNMVFGAGPLGLVPWRSEPERSESEEARAEIGRLIDYAHRLHMKFISFGTDFTYHPELLEEFGASLSPEDPRFWDALQAKYRRLFEVLPELDGVATFVADEQRYWGNYRKFDVLRGGESDWCMEKRHRLFVTKVWEVVVGDFDKLLLHRTWATNMYDQQAQPDVYRRIFTDEVPTKNLFIIPSFTQNDRWWFQAYNPTLNQTPHSTMVVTEPMDYHADGKVFPTFPGFYFQAGLQAMLDVPGSNLKGASLDVARQAGWRRSNLTAYTASRLFWNYHQDPRGIAEDFAAIQCGPEAAKGMGEIIAMTPTAYKYGLYIEPAAYGEFNSLPHIRVGQFIAEGYTDIDGGKVHIDFLHELYLRCKPWLEETLMYLDHGLRTAEAMAAKYGDVKPHIADAGLAADLEESLELARLLITTNNRYVKTFLAYFIYRENRCEADREKLASLTADLEATRNAFASAPGFEYQLFGVDVLIANAKQMLEDPDRAEATLASAPSTEEIERDAIQQQGAFAAFLEQHAGEAQKILHWRGKIDGSDLLRMSGERVEIEHLRWDAPSVEVCEVIAPLPGSPGTVIIKDIATEPLHPFVIDQPRAENGFTVEIYLNDKPGGANWWEFDLYFIPKPPRALGLKETMKAGG